LSAEWDGRSNKEKVGFPPLLPAAGTEKEGGREHRGGKRWHAGPSRLSKGREKKKGREPSSSIPPAKRDMTEKKKKGRRFPAPHEGMGIGGRSVRIPGNKIKRTQGKEIPLFLLFSAAGGEREKGKRREGALLLSLLTASVKEGEGKPVEGGRRLKSRGQKEREIVMLPFPRWGKPRKKETVRGFAYRSVPSPWGGKKGKKRGSEPRRPRVTKKRKKRMEGPKKRGRIGFRL